MRTLFSILLLALVFAPARAQDTLSKGIEEHAPIDTTASLPPDDPYPFNSKRVRTVAFANAAGYGATMVALYATWYKDYEMSSFHTFNDNAEWLQVDKMGHAYSAYAAGKASMEMWRWTGISRTKRILFGGLSGAFYLTAIETLDGFSEEWGWSWGDFSANLGGSGLFIVQEFAWDEQRVQMKWSFHKKKYKAQNLNARSDEIFGKSTPERLFKDYNGQTYWLSGTLKSFFPKANVPAWLQVSVGTGAEGLFGARSNYDETNGVTTFDERGIARYRQWYLAPDVDLTKIKTNKKGLKILLNILNIFKFPAPALEYSRKGLKMKFLHF